MTGEIPRVLRTIVQPSSAGGAKAEKEATEKELARSSHGTAQEIGFFAHNLAGESRSFTVLAGEGAPTMTEGWVKLAKIQRYQRVSVTVPEGYDPLVVTVPIRFEAVANTKNRQHIEEDILTLEWMAGRPETTGELTGEPPYVMVYSTNSEGNLTNLVPKPFQTIPGRSQQWWVTGIAWDTSPIRDRGGERLRQAAVVTLTEVVTSEGALQRNRENREKVKNQYKTVQSSSSANTIKKIASREGIPGSWKAILEANKNLGTSAEKPLKNHTKVKIPLTAFQQVPK